MNLATNQYLFTVAVNPSEMPCICVRHDVDGLVWQPRPKQPDDMLEHIATFNALGKTLDVERKQSAWCQKKNIKKKLANILDTLITKL